MNRPASLALEERFGELRVISRMMHLLPPPADKLLKCIEELIEETIPKFLCLAVDIEEWFVTEHEHVRSLLGAEAIREVRERFGHLLRECFFEN